VTTIAFARAAVELLDHVARTGREPGDVGTEVVGNVRRVVEQAGEVELRDVEELLPGDGLQHRVDVVDLPGQLDVPVEHGSLGGFQDAVQAAQHREGQDHPAVLGLLVVPPQQIGYRPDEGRVSLDVLLGHSAPSPDGRFPSLHHSKGGPPCPSCRDLLALTSSRAARQSRIQAVSRSGDVGRVQLCEVCLSRCERTMPASSMTAKG
jgi:hypothetical protein